MKWIASSFPIDDVDWRWHVACMSIWTMERPLCVLLYAECGSRLARARAAVEAAGCRVRVYSGPLLELENAIVRFAPDVIVIDTASPDRDTLEGLCVMSQRLPKPLVVFTDDADSAKLRRAVRAGVAAYVVAGLDAARVRPILEAAMARHERASRLAEELARARKELSDRQAVDEAKRLLMAQGMSEPEAHRWLRKQAMDRGSSLARLARQLLAQSRG